MVFWEVKGMKKFAVVAGLAVAAWFVSLSVLHSSPPPYTPKRINKAVELLAAGQPIYYTQLAAPAAGAYERGKEMAQTYADYITYEMEHGSFSIANLREFMRGLVDGGPTKSGHRTPAVIVTLPITGIDEFELRANRWMIDQVLSSGVHGILLCHARSVEAVQYFVRSSRYPTQKSGPSGGLAEGLRGAGSQGFASQIWGISGQKYTEVAEPWPLNPNGEILLGLKIEDRHALENAEMTTRVPGIGFAEWGPGDMAMSLGVQAGRGARQAPEMTAARKRVLEATQAAKIAFLNTVTVDSVTQMIDEGVRIGAGGGAEAADKGRKYTKREMPW
jgi:4-hydroxy-2-oxoheptanedioate aldolase